MIPNIDANAQCCLCDASPQKSAFAIKRNTRNFIICLLSLYTKKTNKNKIESKYRMKQQENQNMDTTELVQRYIAQLSPTEKIAYEIAVEKLESSFDIEKSIGFLEFVKDQSVVSSASSSSSST